MEKTQSFNKIQFCNVFNVNLDMMVNRMKSKAESKAALIGNPLVTYDENSQMAIDFFISVLAEELAEKVKI